MAFIYRCPVRSSWLDYNGHMNVVPYFEVFCTATSLVERDLGLAASYLDEGYTLFSGDVHITYVREIRGGATITVGTRILDVDAKRFVIHHEMIDDGDGALAATAEVVELNVGVKSRKVEPFRPDILERLRRAQRKSVGDAPRNVGRAATLKAVAPVR
ncbi:thioesterase family protein [Bradyrhizobium sp. CAR08]